MKREFIYTKKFDKEWEKQSLTDEDLRQLELYLIENPDIGDIMQGTGGLRKIRWSLVGRGKSGGIRVLYIDLTDRQLICMIDLFPKDEKENLSKAERNAIKQIVKIIAEELRK
ncbi:toxin RelE [Spirochaetia bacterium]|nr:toxin RelE [Spirochaetia bacterium]